MSKLKLLILPIVLSLFLLPNTAVLAQTETYDSEAYDYSDYDLDYWDEINDYTYEYDSTLSEEDAAGLLAGTMFTALFTGIWLAFILAISLGTYIFVALALSKIGKKLGYENTWFAWVPILNVIMLFQLGEQNPWLLLLLLIPGIGALIIMILSVVAYMKISERLGYDKLLGLLILVPLGYMVLLGILAWKDKEPATVLPTA